MAHEELGYGRWGNCDSGVPRTEKGEVLAALDAGDPHHPKLVPSEGVNKCGSSGDAKTPATDSISISDRE